jgi:hypothetical protein
VLRIEYFASGRVEELSSGGSGGRRRWFARARIVAFLWVGAGAAAQADPSIVLPNGLPVQVQPTFAEPGLPAFSFPDGSGLSVGGLALAPGMALVLATAPAAKRTTR